MTLVDTTILADLDQFYEHGIFSTSFRLRWVKQRGDMMHVSRAIDDRDRCPPSLIDNRPKDASWIIGLNH